MAVLATYQYLYIVCPPEPLTSPHPHSNAGISRSSSIALAYVMRKEKTPLAQALEGLRETRPAV